MAQKRLFTGPPVASIEMSLAVYPAAIILLYKVIAHAFPTVMIHFSAQVSRAVIVMVAGLCLCAKKPTARAISKLLGVVSHDALTRLLTHSCWNASMLRGALLNQALLLTTGSSLPSYLILDDVVIPKPFAKWIAGAYWDWDHVEQRKVFCHRVVVVVWTNSVMVIPVAFALWHKRHSVYFLNPTASFTLDEYKRLSTQFPHIQPLLCSVVTFREDTILVDVSSLSASQKTRIGKKAFALIAAHAANHHRYRTKNQLARCLVYCVVRKGLCGEYITFDSWYASKENLNFLTRLGLIYYAAIPCSRNVIEAFQVSTCAPLSHEPQSVRTLAASYTARHFIPYPQGRLRALGLLVNLPGLNHGAKLVIIKRRDWLGFLKQRLPSNHPVHKQKDTDPNTYLLTNHLFCPTYQVILHYRSRWTIEIMFRDLKQHFGLAACQHRNLDAVRRHIVLAMFAYVCLQLIRQEHLVSPSVHHLNSLTIGDVKKHLQSQVLVKLTDTVSPGMITLDQRPMPVEIFNQLTDPAASPVISNFSFLRVTLPDIKELDNTAYHSLNQIYVL